METRKSKPLVAYSVTEILDRTFRIYRDGFLTFIGLAAVVTVPLTLINYFLSLTYLQSFSQMYYDAEAYQSPFVSYFFVIFLVGIIGTLLQVVLVNGLITYLAAESHLGNKPTIMEAFTAVRGRLLPLTAGIILFGILMVVISIVSGIATMCLIGILGFGLLIYMGTCIYAFLPPVIILENVGVGRAISRAWALAKQRFWPLFGMTIVIAIISWVVSLSFTSAQQLLFPQQGVASIETLQTSQTILSTFLEIIIGVLVAPILPIGYTLMYFDARVRVEGLDIALQSVDKPDPRPADVASPPLNSRFVGKDYLNIIILTVGIFAFYALLFGVGLLANPYMFSPR